MKYYILILLFAFSAVEAAQITVNELPPAASVADADTIMIVQGGVTKKASAAFMRAIGISQVSGLQAALDGKGALAGDNTWPGNNNFSGNLAFGNPPQARSALGMAGELQKASYIAAHFKISSENLFVAVSEDGIAWRDQIANYTPPIAGVRDPSLIYWSGAYYCAYTINAFAPPETRFAIARSVDGVNWSHLRNVDLASIAGGPEYVWAPELRIVDGNVICLVSVSVNSMATFQTYLIQGWSDDLSTSGTPTLISGLAANTIDASVIREGSTYYLFYKNEAVGQKVVEVATASALAGPYTVQRSGNWAGWGTNMEGPNVVKLPSGKFRVYLDNIGTIYYSDSATTDLLGSWSSAVGITGITCQHPCIIRSPLGYLTDATTAIPGKVELATDAETQTGTDAMRAVPPSSLAAWWTWVKTQAQTFAGNLGIGGNLTSNGSVVLGDALGDTLNAANGALAVSSTGQVTAGYQTANSTTSLMTRDLFASELAIGPAVFVPIFSTNGVTMENSGYNSPSLDFSGIRFGGTPTAGGNYNGASIRGALGGPGAGNILFSARSAICFTYTQGANGPNTKMTMFVGANDRNTLTGQGYGVEFGNNPTGSLKLHVRDATAEVVSASWLGTFGGGYGLRVILVWDGLKTLSCYTAPDNTSARPTLIGSVSAASNLTGVPSGYLRFGYYASAADSGADGSISGLKIIRY